MKHQIHRAAMTVSVVLFVAAIASAETRAECEANCDAARRNCQATCQSAEQCRDCGINWGLCKLNCNDKPDPEGYTRCVNQCNAEDDGCTAKCPEDASYPRCIYSCHESKVRCIRACDQYKGSGG